MHAAKFIVLYVEFRLNEDDWKDGETLEANSVWTEDVDGQFSFVSEALKHIPYVDNLINVGDDVLKTFECDPCHEDDFSRFDADFTIDATNHGVPVPATADAVEQWKLGKKTLFNLHVSVVLRKIGWLCKEDAIS